MTYLFQAKFGQVFISAHSITDVNAMFSVWLGKKDAPGMKATKGRTLGVNLLSWALLHISVEGRVLKRLPLRF